MEFGNVGRKQLLQSLCNSCVHRSHEGTHGTARYCYKVQDDVTIIGGCAGYAGLKNSATTLIKDVSVPLLGSKMRRLRWM